MILEHLQETLELLLLDEAVGALGLVLAVDHVEYFLQVISAMFLVLHVFAVVGGFIDFFL
jgi:hypothetical protein